MEMVNVLGRTSGSQHQPAITVISGQACIRFAKPYNTWDSYDLSGLRRIQAFNPEASFDFPPDERHVFDLDYGFPGTIVTLRFSLDWQSLIQRENSDD